MMIFVLFFLTSFVNANLSKYYSFGRKKSYQNIESIHDCIEAVRNDFLTESCSSDAYNKMIPYMKGSYRYQDIVKYLQSIDTEYGECVNKNNLESDKCYYKAYNTIAELIIYQKEPTTNGIQDYSKNLIDINKNLALCQKDQNEVINKCQTSSFVIDNIRACVNNGIETFYRETYKNVKGGQMAKTDVTQALVSLQQTTINDKVGIVGGTRFLQHLDLLMDRLTFCSEMINSNEARGV